MAAQMQAQAQAQMQQAQMQQMQAQQIQAQSQQEEEPSYIKKTTGPNMVESILTVLPTMMGPLMSANRPGMIIAELDKMAPPPQQSSSSSQPAVVEVCNEEDDPDVAEALKGMSSS
jgi:hypothetical protein